MATKFVNMRRWGDEKLDRELAFAMLDSPDGLEREWAEAVNAEQRRRAEKSA